MALRALRVHANSWLVEQQDLWIMQQRGGQVEAAFIPH